MVVFGNLLEKPVEENGVVEFQENVLKQENVKNLKKNTVNGLVVLSEENISLNVQ